MQYFIPVMSSVISFAFFLHILLLCLSMAKYKRILSAAAFLYCGIVYLTKLYYTYKIVFKDKALCIHYVNPVRNKKVRVVQYDEIEVVYKSYRRSPHKNNILIRNSENKEILAWVMAHFHCSIQLNDEFSIRPDVKIIRVEMK